MRARFARLIVCAATLAALVPSCALAQIGDAVVTPERAAVLTVARPGSPANIFLDVSVKSYAPPSQGQVEAVVSLAPKGGELVEVGRFTFFPAGPFTASGPRDQRAYRFDASAVLSKLKPGDSTLTLQVALVPTDDKTSPRGATLTLSKAEFSPRP